MSAYDIEQPGPADRDASARTRSLGARGAGAAAARRELRRDRRASRSRRRVRRGAHRGPRERAARPRASSRPAPSARRAPPPRRRLGARQAVRSPAMATQEPATTAERRACPRGACRPTRRARIAIGVDWPERVTREWAWGGSTGEGVRVCILDSGVEAGHPLGRRARRARSRSSRRGRRDSRSSRTREGDLCGHGTACAGIVRSLAPDCELHSVRVLGAGVQGQRLGAARRPALGGRPGLRRHQHEPLDDEAPVRRRCCTSWPTAPTSAARVLVASAHNMPVESYPVALLVGHLGREPRGARPARVLLQPEPAGRVLRARGRRRGRLARRRHDPLERQQLRDAAHRRDLRADPRQAPGADAVPAQERALPDRQQRRRRRRDERRSLRAAVAAGALGSEERYRALLQSIVEVARAIFGARASSSSSTTRRPTSSSSRPSPARARTSWSAGASRPAPASPAGCS